MAKTQGGAANHQGKVLEKTVVSVFESHGFEIIAHKAWCKKKDAYGTDLLLKDVPYKTIYGHNGKTEFLAKSECFALDVRIECKWQQSKGSVDEKLPYLYLNCIEKMPEKDIIIIADGGGAKPGAISWLKNAVKQGKYISEPTEKNIQVFSIQEFIGWVNKTLR